MSNLQLLDCTLRDGGYVNDFQFGKYGIRKIISQLTESGIDVVECGFLEDGVYDENSSVFQSVEQIADLLPKEHNRTLYVAMACYGEYSLNKLSDYDGSSIDGVRVSFHYSEVEEAMDYCRQVKQKGYKVFVQPVGTTSYSQEKLSSLIAMVNDIEPYALYFVDTLGLMHEKDVLSMFSFIDDSLKENIRIGFHSHNNLQLSYSNAQALIGLNTQRQMLIDSSVYGMGRGAGNLNTELIVNYINEKKERRYEVEPLLEVVDEFIIAIREKYKWGYSVPYYLAAVNGCHPNYASYLSNKQTLNVKSISTILRMIEPERRSLFDKDLAEQKYLEFQNREIDDTDTLFSLKNTIEGKDVLLIAPGTSVGVYRDLIQSYAEKCVTMAVAYVPNFIKCNYVFFSNLKRFNAIDKDCLKTVNLIHTSNITIDDPVGYTVNYSSLLNESDVIMDNAALMALNMLVKLQPSRVLIAGMDGYVYGGENYIQKDLKQEQQLERFELLNKEISIRLKEISQKLSIEFVTPSCYEL